MSKRRRQESISESYKRARPRTTVVTTTSPAVRNRSRRRYSRSGYYRRSGYYGRFAKQTDEQKFFDTTLSFTIDTTAHVAGTGQLVLIPQNVTESGRDGRKCTVSSINIKMVITLSPGAGANPSGATFIALIQDTQCNGAAAALTDIYTSNPLVTGVNLANSSRFKILKKWVHNWNPLAGVTTAYCNVTNYVDYYKKCNIPLEFSGTTGVITELKSNNLFLLVGASAAAIDNLVSVNGICRVRFRG